jgi:hypothetical protein
VAVFAARLEAFAATATLIAESNRTSASLKIESGCSGAEYSAPPVEIGTSHQPSARRIKS